ncbi:hypothetical protein LXL04_015402 [Taraxacum kok-saghyz]
MNNPTMVGYPRKREDGWSEVRLVEFITHDQQWIENVPSWIYKCIPWISNDLDKGDATIQLATLCPDYDPLITISLSCIKSKRPYLKIENLIVQGGELVSDMKKMHSLKIEAMEIKFSLLIHNGYCNTPHLMLYKCYGYRGMMYLCTTDFRSFVKESRDGRGRTERVRVTEVSVRRVVGASEALIPNPSEVFVSRNVKEGGSQKHL